MAKKATLTYRDILSDIKKKNFAPVYLLMGEEPYYLDLIANALENSVVDEADRDFNFNMFFGAEATPEEVAATAAQYPMMAEHRFVILKEAQAMERAKQQLEYFETYMQHPLPTTVFVIVFKGDNLNATSAMVKAAAAHGAVIFKSPKLREYQLDGPIKDYCASKKIGIDDKALSLLKEHVGTDLSKLFGEIDKLIVATSGKVNRISAEVIEENIGISKDFNNFELTTALATKDYSKAMTIIEFFQRNPKQNPTVVTTGILFNFFTKMVLANFSKDKSDTALMQILGLKTPYALREIRTGLSRYNSLQSVKAISEIRRFDTRSKGIGSVANEYDLLKELIFNIFTA